MTLVVNKRKSPCDVYIGRGSPWGNPFVIGIHGTRDEVIDRYAAWIRTQPALMRALPLLKDKVLGCYCKPARCHGDVLVQLVEQL
jgi:hypothetical protein